MHEDEDSAYGVLVGKARTKQTPWKTEMYMEG
jgi:hypothetical protein